jgi:hypothetical protein
MKDEYARAIVGTTVLLGFFYFAMSFGLGFVFDDNVAGLLAAAATWFLPVLLGAQAIRLPYRYGIWSASFFGGLTMALTIASVIGGPNSHGVNILAFVILMLPATAVHGLLERILFTAEERLEIKSRHSRRYQIP